MMKDPFGRGLVAGLAGVLTINAVEFLLMYLNLSETPLWQAGGIVFLTESALQTPLGIAIGIFSHVFIAIVLGIIIAYYIHYTDVDFAILKGVGLSLIAGFIVLTIIFPFRGLAADMQSSPGDVLSALIDHTVFGALAGFIIKYLQVRDDQKDNVPESQVNYVRFSPHPHSETKKTIFKKPKKI
ncbi:MAG: hypothetical protein SCK29_10345 [Bacillota bacterium]|nr:hypothetical protein [Bacillota bacterium]MDW7684501.1 hypothetical protein [Bacillota bacterium]